MPETKAPTPPCPHWRPAAGLAEEGTAVCGLLQEIAGVENPALCQVRADACRACCGWFRPSKQAVNPVIASLLYHLSSRVLECGGVAGCSRDIAARLYSMAVDNIPPEDDYVCEADEIHRQANLDCSDLSALIPRPRRRCEPRVVRWAAGVTTAPRERPMLDVCLQSMAAAGWPEPRLFVDGDVPLSAESSRLPATRRLPQIGAWPSYYLALAELVLREPQADAYLLAQDDVVFFRHPGVRSYLETVLWPGQRPGLVSLYCSRAYTHAEPGWHELPEALVWGGQTLVFSRPAALAFLSDPQVVRHRMTPQGLANLDGLIGDWAWRTSTPVHVPTPSLVQHVGHVSSLWQNVRSFGFRRADRFAGHPR